MTSTGQPLAEFFENVPQARHPGQPGCLTEPPAEHEATEYRRRVKQTALHLLEVFDDVEGQLDERHLRALALDGLVDPVYYQAALDHLLANKVIVSTTMLAFPRSSRERYVAAKGTR